MIAVVVFGAMGVAYGSLKDGDVGWLNPAVGGVIGVLFGASMGYGVAMEVREPKPKGAHRVLVVVGLVICVVVGAGVRYLHYKT